MGSAALATIHRRRFANWGILLGLCLAMGCSQSWLQPPEPKQAEQVKPRPTQRRVLVDGQALVLGQQERPAEELERFAQRFFELQQQGRAFDSRHWVQQYPDAALELLRNTDCQEAQQPHLRQIAWLHDQQCTAGGPERGWRALLLQRSASPQAFQAYDQGRNQLMILLRNGKFEEVSQVNLPQLANSVGHPLVQMDAFWLTGIAELAANRPEAAIVPLQQGIQTAAQLHTHAAIQMELILSEAYRRSGNHQQANQVWSQAVTRAASLLGRPNPVADPVLWERIAYLHPVGIAWPQSVQVPLRHLGHRVGLSVQVPTMQAAARCSQASSPEPLEVFLWAAIGDWRLERGEYQQALMAFKRAEASASPHCKDWMRFSQAKALKLLNQQPAATGIWVVLAGKDPNLAVTRAAQAALGSLRLQQKMTQQALVFLRKSLEDNQLDWPTRAEAEADLGLAYLLVGDESAGLHWLRQAQERFGHGGDLRLLVRSLENEARYFEHLGNTQRVAELEQRIQTVQR